MQNVKTERKNKYCFFCDEKMIPFEIRLIYKTYMGMICPVCGSWVYTKEKSEISIKRDAVYTS